MAQIFILNMGFANLLEIRVNDILECI